jgi:NAD-reducing hydrogenase small subunit
MAKPKVASDWMAGCAGCHMSLLDIDERIIDIAELVEIRATPITDLKVPDKEGVDVGILEGGVNNTSNEEQAHTMRERCKILVAFGDCAVFGGVPAMRNFFEIEEALRRAYIETESTDSEGMIPTHPELSKPTPVRALQEVVPVDIFLPGCPPNPDAIFYVLGELANGHLPVLKDKYLHWH